jgi:hypothetical protein
MSRIRSAVAEEVDTAPARWLPETDAAREAIREQVGRILASAGFRNSRRFPSFLQYTVEQALNGTAGSLKERTLGVEAFGRAPDYDTAQDPVVRMTAGEVRKRLFQYYSAPEHANEIRIEFQPGSYIPEFYRPPALSPLSEAATETMSTDDGSLSSAQSAPRVVAASRRRTPWLMAGLAASALIILAIAAAGARAALLGPSASTAARDQFWEPVVIASAPALLCIGETTSEFLHRNVVSYTDAVTLAQLSGELRARQKPFRIRRPESTAFADLRDGPVILVGGFNNAWTMRLGEGLRFTLAREDARRYIQDRQHPDSRAWSAGGKMVPLASVQETYGLITRVFDPRTGHPVVMTAGLNLGTRAAGECLIDAECLEAARRLAPGDWRRRNIQVVVATKVIGEEPGAPRVVAAHLW